jgi:zinc transport system substrate-binding protein
VRLARQRKVATIFVEPLVSPRLAETLAREVGAKVLALNPIEGVTAEEAAAGKGYADLMAQNLDSLRAGLGCK